jgi:hypothetical protein
VATTSSSSNNKSSNLAKICVFCGESPREKTKEHVLPLWLIRLTGDPNRQANIHVDFAAETKVKRFAFDQFTLPACGACNAAFATMEARAEPIMRMILREQALSEADWDLLLSWFDKVRVGLWLSKYLLSKNSLGINPHFYVAQRLDVRDRALIVFRRESTVQTLTIIGTFLPSFDFSPTSFALIVNNYLFVNLTGIDLCSHRLGFPSINPLSTDGSRVEGALISGSHRIISPILRNFPHPEGTGLYQPIYSDLLTTEEIGPAFDNEYVTRNSIDQARGIGGVFQQRLGKAGRYPAHGSTLWIPGQQLDNDRILRIAHTSVYQHQIAQMTSALQVSPREQKRFWKEQISSCRRVLRRILS